MTALRRLLLASSSGLLLVAIVFVGSLVLWVGVPLGWPNRLHEQLRMARGFDSHGQTRWRPCSW